ncbi:tRNA (adenosine(37)-N6)-dimethylallyltransferase MiaA [Alteromonas sp. 5E99-2]|uniref:tRNA (adenosine(37)-N6)-dimethylallyltransferase MiaA n=1 Tax=Alteromonas sp. 5E99-2 TaxID=2817683 RepID=UPI001A990129|nr:tRNA (adenosine(37)-N6)-dimethylallyltransferase MiaA [Alteromonas sp. 5E99-2]MBO1255793.1 tRNA (adenosine(37)-N6)-dimethylallyltransferase MiaA [Alteromonas sp. 5E99-2]
MIESLENTPEEPVIAIMGPTASGKTALSIEVAKKLDGEIISVDSALIYRGMDIGTAKPCEKEKEGIPHWLIDTHDPSESYSVSAFFDDTLRLVKDIRQRGKTPILVGGTMMYFNALVKGIASLPKGDLDVKKAIEEEAAKKGWIAMHEYLRSIDPECAHRIHPNDPQRITRAIEVHRISGKPLSWWQDQTPKIAPFKLYEFAIAPENRSDLHERIAKRFHIMLEQGLVQEVEKLFARPDLNRNMAAIRSVGYRQVWEYLEGSLNETEMAERGIIATRQLAKRQLTWLRGWSSLTWLDTFDDERLAKLLAKIAR